MASLPAGYGSVARLRKLIMMIIPVILALFAQVEDVPFKVCAESKSWVRPTDGIQAKIWDDPRYPDGRKAYEWTHNFLVHYGGASPQYHLMNQTGLWTAGDIRWLCNDREREQQVGTGSVVEVWILLQRVKAIKRDGLNYTVVVEPAGEGFQLVDFPGTEANLTLNFITPDGTQVDQIIEGMTPGTYRRR